MATRDHADKVGIVGATLAALCCLGVPAILSVVAALGLGFLINDAVLAPLLLLSVAVVAWGLTAGWRRHGNPSPLILGIVAGLLLFASAFLIRSTTLAYISIVGLIAASVLNAYLTRSAERARPV
jgi:mercuric ion transport protein